MRRECTVLFSDLRGFTSFSESLQPDEVIEVLNVYLEEMSDAIMDHGGTLVSYIGDGIMAVFGAPIEQADHADRAIAAAQEMLEVRLPAFNRWMREAGSATGSGWGSASTAAQVMSGQVGSERRIEYTAIGDTTNTAARLEGMTKGRAPPLHRRLDPRAAPARSRRSRSIGELEVRGRQRPVRIWSVEAASDAAFEQRQAAGYGALAK